MSYEAAITGLSPTFRWRLDGSTAEVGGHGTSSSGSMVWGSSIIPTVTGQCWQSNGTARINPGNSGQMNTDSATHRRTLSFWFMSDNPTGWQNIYEEGGSTHGWHVALYDDYLTFNITQNKSARCSIQTQIQSVVAYHVFVAFDLSDQSGTDNCEMWVNGVSVGTTRFSTQGFLNSHGGDIQFGEDGDGKTLSGDAGSKTKTDFRGKIQDVCYWSEVQLGSTEAAQIFAATQSSGDSFDVTATGILLAAPSWTGPLGATGVAIGASIGSSESSLESPAASVGVRGGPVSAVSATDLEIPFTAIEIGSVAFPVTAATDLGGSTVWLGVAAVPSSPEAQPYVLQPDAALGSRSVPCVAESLQSGASATTPSAAVSVEAVAGAPSIPAPAEPVVSASTTVSTTSVFGWAPPTVISGTAIRLSVSTVAIAIALNSTALAFPEADVRRAIPDQAISQTVRLSGGAQALRLSGRGAVAALRSSRQASRLVGDAENVRLRGRAQKGMRRGD